jgi:hypothetical protein
MVGFERSHTPARASMVWRRTVPASARANGIGFSATDDERPTSSRSNPFRLNSVPPAQDSGYLAGQLQGIERLGYHRRDAQLGEPTMVGGLDFGG